MSTIIRQLQPDTIRKTAKRCRNREIIVPTFKQLRDPTLVPISVRSRLAGVGMSELNPINLFRITWKNDMRSGLYGGVNYLEMPPALTGVKARIIGLIGSYFPTGSHKVGAAFGCLVPRLVSGEFDPEIHRAAWPSTGNYCRGGAFDCALLDCAAIAILPEEMSRERFDWLREIGATVIATPGCESNVKGIYDKCWELRRDPANVVFNQFDEFGNPIFHYNVTGPAVEEVFYGLHDRSLRAAAFVSATGSAGTIAAGDFLKAVHPQLRIVAAEPLQCPTLLQNGFGPHRIEGIGGRHIPWVHNVRNTDAVAAIDDEDCMRIVRLFNEPAGRDYLASLGVAKKHLKKLPLLGISSVCNLLAAIKAAKYYDMDGNDVIFTVFTDSMQSYQSRLVELREQRGDYREKAAVADFAGPLSHQSVDRFRELSHLDRKAIHNLKYFTWVEQQGKTLRELDAQWDPEYWRAMFEDEIGHFERLIVSFNKMVTR